MQRSPRMSNSYWHLIQGSFIWVKRNNGGLHVCIALWCWSHPESCTARWDWGTCYYASTMPSTEESYGQMGKEVLIMVNEINAFNNYICGSAIKICQAKSCFLDFSLKTSIPFQVCSNECCHGVLWLQACLQAGITDCQCWRTELADAKNVRSCHSTSRWSCCSITSPYLTSLHWPSCENDCPGPRLVYDSNEFVGIPGETVFWLINCILSHKQYFDSCIHKCCFKRKL